MPNECARTKYFFENEKFFPWPFIVCLDVTIISCFLWAAMRHKKSKQYEYQMSIKDQYAEFLIRRLIVDIKAIDDSLLELLDINIIGDITMVHESLWRVIESFRVDALKLESPNQAQLNLPLTTLYAMDADEKKRLKCSTYNAIELCHVRELVKYLLYGEAKVKCPYRHCFFSHECHIEEPVNYF